MVEIEEEENVIYISVYTTKKCTVTVAIQQENTCQQCSSLHVSTELSLEPMQTKRIKVIIQEPIEVQ